MKKILLIILNLMISHLLLGQHDSAKDSLTDPFCQMIRKIFSLEAMNFNSQHRMKQVFENDTVTSNAKVFAEKNGTAVSFLQIIPEEGDNELLYCFDSAWVIDHENGIMKFIGTGFKVLKNNGNSKFFPFNLFEIDTLISQIEPFWRVIEKSKDHTVVSLDINISAEELTGNRVEITIGNSDFLPYKIIQEAVYMDIDEFFQEQEFSGYSLPGPGHVKIPGYFSLYKRVFGSAYKNDRINESPEEGYLEETFPQDVKLFDLKQDPVNLPDEGLIFLDFWYAGCAPCLKSAPVIEKLYNEFKGQVHFFSINEIDKDTAKIARVKDKMKITFPVLLCGKEKLSAIINGSGAYPMFILVDGKKRKILWKMEGYSENLEELIRKALAQNL